MHKTKIILLVFSLFSLAAMSGSFWSFFRNDTDPEGLRIAAIESGLFSDRKIASSQSASVKGESSYTAINLATVPLFTLEWEKPDTKKNSAKKIAYRNGDLVITADEELRLAMNSVTSGTIRWHAIEAEDIDTDSITSRTIEDRTIRSSDLARTLTIDSLSIAESLSLGDGYFLTLSGTAALDQNLRTTDTPTFAGLITTGQNAFRINPYGTAAGNTGELRFYELAGNGTNYIGFKSPDAIASNVIWTFPNADGSANQVLTTNGSGGLEWQTSGASAPTDATYLTLSYNSSLSAERLLTGSSQITITDGGADAAATLSITADSIGDAQLAYDTGQALATTSSPTFTGLTISGTSALGTVTSGTWNGTDITDSYINFGTGAGQISATDLPITDSGSYFTGITANTNAVLQHIGQEIGERWSSGVVSGGTITPSTGNTVDIASGVGYIGSTRITWNASIGEAMTQNGDNWISIDSAGAVVIHNTEPSINDYIRLGYVYTTAGNSVIGLSASAPSYAGNYESRNNNFVTKSIGPIVQSGNIVGTTATPLNIQATGGTINSNLKEFVVSDTSVFTKWYNSLDNGWVTDTADNLVNTTKYNVTGNNQASALVTMTAGYWKKDLILRTLDGNLHYIYGQAQFATEQAAKDSALPSIPAAISTGGSAYLATAVVQNGDATLTSRLYDIRPNMARVFGFGTSGTTGSIATHSALSGLTADDHTQYLLTSGTRAMAGTLNLGTNAITFVTSLTMAGLLQNTLTTEQMRLRYDASNYASFTVDATGALAIDTTGATLTTMTNGANVGTGYGYSIAGANVLSLASGGVVVGSGNTHSSSGVTLGKSNTNSGITSAAVGISNTVSATTAVAMGYNNQANFSGAVAMGGGNTATQGIAIGTSNTANAAGAIAIGKSVSNTTATSLMIGPSDAAKLTILGAAGSVGYIGIGTATPTNILSLGNAAARKFWIENTATDVVGRDLTVAAGGTVAGTSVSNVTGGNLILQSGLGTGTGTSTISFQTGTTLTTGTTLQTMSTKMTILGSGNVGIGTTTPASRLHVSNLSAASPTTLSQNLLTASSGTAGEYIALQNTANSTSSASAILKGTRNSVTPIGSASALYGTENAVSSSGGGVVTDMYGTYNSLGTSLLSPVTNVYGTYSSINSYSGVTIANAYGSYVTFGSAGAVTNTYGSYIAFPASGSLGNVYGQYIGDASTPSGASSYGLYLADQVYADPGTAYYALYSAGGQSYFADSVGIGTASTASARLSVDRTSVVTTSGSEYGATILIDDSGTTTGIDTTYGLAVDAYRYGAVAGTNNTYGVSSNVFADDPISGVSNAYGFKTAVSSSGGTSPDNSYGLYASIIGKSVYGMDIVFDNTPTGGLTTGYGVRITSSTLSGLGMTTNYGLYVGSFSATTNAYGIYLADQGTGASDYAIYSAGGKSYFAGNIGIGDTTPDGILDFDQTSTSTTGATTYGGNFTVSDTGIVTTSTDVTYGTLTSVTRTGATGGVLSTYGQSIVITTDNAGGGVSSAYGSYINTGISGTTNADTVFGQFITTEANTGTATGLYVDAGTGAGTEYAAAFVNGNVGIGTATPAYTLDVLASGTGIIAQFQSANTTGCTLADGGTITCTSDERMKKNIASFDGGLDTLMSLRPVRYNWKYENDGEEKSFGFIAQEVETTLPKLVVTDANGYKQLNTIGLIPIIARSIQEQQGIIDIQTSNISDLSFKTDQNITTLEELQASVDTQLTVVGTRLDEQSIVNDQQETEIAALGARFLTSDDRLTALETLTDQMTLDMNTQAAKTILIETQMKTLIDQVQTLADFFTAFELGNLVATDADGNVDLLGGTLKARILETGGLVIENAEPDAPTIGRGTMKIGETEVIIETASVNSTSHIIVTPRDVTTEPLAVTEVIDAESFTVEISNPTAKDISFDWWIVEGR